MIRLPQLCCQQAGVAALCASQWACRARRAPPLHHLLGALYRRTLFQLHLMQLLPHHEGKGQIPVEPRPCLGLCGRVQGSTRPPHQSLERQGRPPPPPPPGCRHPSHSPSLTTHLMQP